MACVVHISQGVPDSLFKQACACVQLGSWSVVVDVYKLFHLIMNLWIRCWN